MNLIISDYITNAQREPTKAVDLTTVLVLFDLAEIAAVELDIWLVL